MNKLVYLYELDSIRISPWEIDRGRKALYEEIVMRGNRVVLTFQQLTDSKIFLELLKDKKDFEIITSLFENGALRLSEYCDPHTGKRIYSASQYLQNALEGGRTRFIFSNAPVNNEDLKVIQCAQEALQYCNLDSLRNLKQDVGQLENYIELMFHISIQQHAMNPVKEGSVYTLPYMINWVRRAKFDNENFQKLFLSGSNCLQDVKSKIIASRENLQSRSVWLKNLKEEEKSEEIKSMAEVIVDLCYNYVVEDSIENVSKRYWDFLSDFQEKIYEFWEEYEEGKHALMNGKYPLKPKIIRKLNWSVAKREWENVKLKKPTEPAILYKDVFWENRLWEWKVFLGNLKKWFWAFLYIAFFVVIMKKEAEFEKYVNGKKIFLNLYTVMGGLYGKNWTVGIVGVVIAGIISSVLLKIFKVPDVLESIQTITQVITDSFCKLRFRIIKRFL